MKWIQDPVTYQLIPESTYRRKGAHPLWYVVPDIGDVATPHGTVIQGRAALREDLKRENCHIYERGEREAIDARRAADSARERIELHAILRDIAAERGLGDPE